MNRSDFVKLARIRLREARILLKARQFEGAYYLCGYAVECAFKACIAKQTRRYDFPDREKVKDSYTHDLVKLVRIGGLEPDLNTAIGLDAAFRANWNVVKDWSEESRYERHTEQEARDLYKATASPNHGVLAWIRQHW
jgi:hypothetical protein